MHTWKRRVLFNYSTAFQVVRFSRPANVVSFARHLCYA